MTARKLSNRGHFRWNGGSTLSRENSARFKSGPDSFRSISANRLNGTGEARRALGSTFGTPRPASERGDAAHIFRTDRTAASGSGRDRVSHRRPARTATHIHEEALCIIQLVRSLRKSIPVNGERFGKTGPVGEQPALDGSNRNAEADPGRNPLCEETPDQVRGTAFAIEIAQYQPVDPGGRSD